MQSHCCAEPACPSLRKTKLARSSLRGWDVRKLSIQRDAIIFATLTGQGHITLPKETRDRLNRHAGAIVDLEIQADTQGRGEALARQARTQPGWPQVRWPMIGFETNIVLRLWLIDDATQNNCIDALLATRQVRSRRRMSSWRKLFGR